jgi:hypothetical protein
MTNRTLRGTNHLHPISNEEMISVEGGAQVDYFLRLKTLDAESTSAPSVPEIVVTKATDCASSNLY